MADVAEEVCGIHAQVMSSAELSLALRVEGATAADVRHELWERRSLVKTYGHRGTLHLFPAASVHAWLGALRELPDAGGWDRMVGTGTSAEQLEEMVGAVEAALDGQMLTRQELGAAVVKAVGRWAGESVMPGFGTMSPRWSMAIGEACARGLICFGPNRGNLVRFVLLGQWLGRLPGGSDDAISRADLFRRFIAAYGPSSEAEFAQWAHVAPAAARGLAADAGAVEVEVEGTRRWADAPLPARRAGKPSTLLLGTFDVYVVGSFPRDVLIPPRHAAMAKALGVAHGWDRAGRTSLAGNLPVLVVDGVVSGVWERRRAGKRLEIRVQPFIDLDRAQREMVSRAATRVGEILGMTAEVSFGQVVGRAHL